LDQLLKQINSSFPNRNKASDGGIGDAAHASRGSDHNPWFVLNGRNWVTARDFTHDPAHGADMNRMSDELAASRDPRIKYIIFNGLILDSRVGNRPWQWMPYHGTNPHTKHMHVSVMPNASILLTARWNLPMLGGGGGGATPSKPIPNVEEIMTGVDYEMLPYSGNHPDAIEGWVNVALPCETGANSSLIANQWVVLNSAWGDTDYELILVGPNQTLVAPAGSNGFPTNGTLNDRERAVWEVPSGCEGIALRYKNKGAWVRSGLGLPQRTR
jgi:hypothetical protein